MLVLGDRKNRLGKHSSTRRLHEKSRMEPHHKRHGTPFALFFARQPIRGSAAGDNDDEQEEEEDEDIIFDDDIPEVDPMETGEEQPADMEKTPEESADHCEVEHQPEESTPPEAAQEDNQLTELRNCGEYKPFRNLFCSCSSVLILCFSYADTLPPLRLSSSARS